MLEPAMKIEGFCYIFVNVSEPFAQNRGMGIAEREERAIISQPKIENPFPHSSDFVLMECRAIR